MNVFNQFRALFSLVLALSCLSQAAAKDEVLVEVSVYLVKKNDLRARYERGKLRGEAIRWLERKAQERISRYDDVEEGFNTYKIPLKPLPEEERIKFLPHYPESEWFSAKQLGERGYVFVFLFKKEDLTLKNATLVRTIEKTTKIFPLGAKTWSDESHRLTYVNALFAHPSKKPTFTVKATPENGDQEVSVVLKTRYR